MAKPPGVKVMNNRVLDVEAESLFLARDAPPQQAGAPLYISL